MAIQIATFSTQVAETPCDSLNELLKRFWEQEEVVQAPTLTEEDKCCEDLYKRTTTRREDGRYEVKLPLKEDFPQNIALRHTLLAAQQQYISMERILEKKPELRTQYSNDLEEYFTMDQMTQSSSLEIIKKREILLIIFAPPCCLKT